MVKIDLVLVKMLAFSFHFFVFQRQYTRKWVSDYRNLYIFLMYYVSTLKNYTSEYMDTLEYPYGNRKNYNNYDNNIIM